MKLYFRRKRYELRIRVQLYSTNNSRNEVSDSCFLFRWCITAIPTPIRRRLNDRCTFSTSMTDVYHAMTWNSSNRMETKRRSNMIGRVLREHCALVLVNWSINTLGGVLALQQMSIVRHRKVEAIRISVQLKSQTMSSFVSCHRWILNITDRRIIDIFQSTHELVLIPSCLLAVRYRSTLCLNVFGILCAVRVPSSFLVRKSSLFEVN